jgi:hypothetical protein
MLPTCDFGSFGRCGCRRRLRMQQTEVAGECAAAPVHGDENLSAIVVIMAFVPSRVHKQL